MRAMESMSPTGSSYPGFTSTSRFRLSIFRDAADSILWDASYWGSSTTFVCLALGAQSHFATILGHVEDESHAPVTAALLRSRPGYRRYTFRRLQCGRHV